MSYSAADTLSNPAGGARAFALPEQLPDDPAALKALLQAQQRAFEARILELYEQLRLSRQRLFGRASESHAGQGWLFDEAEALVQSAPEASDTADLPPAADARAGAGKKKARGKRKPLPAELPRID
ncbi:transposase domain-containing protein, partial [Rhodocyclaceae bacterium SMB388]